ncbi:PREDICTED: matrix metalloproteinase-14-like [Cyphomyrmex costatus]|uniref:matrix metalloproteinase-14-like n=1 Tax=Cyphomyrmex costatus TaxID=456900 RepID=UPI00085242B1|nr:PREDICTED: matrix metalloproteinase-14-like [Cyphomyrmex costatus]
MSLAYLVVFVSVTVCASTPTAENLVNTEVIEYLQRYGYLNEADVTTHTSIEDEKIKEAIALFQEYYQIPGNADANTLKLATYAFSIWAANTSLTFERKTLNPDILISYRGGTHTYIDNRRKETICSGLFDGPGGVLAHAFPPMNDPMQSTEIHVDVAEPWLIQLNESISENKLHLLYTLTHEIGHSLGLSHNHRADSLMFPYVTDKSATLSIEDILAIQRLYGKNQNEVPSTRSPPVTTDTRKTSTQNLCDLPYVDNVLVLKHHIFVTYRKSIWVIAINGKRYKGPLALNDYLRFLPANVSINPVYQRPSEEIVVFANNKIYMVDYPSFQLKNGWPKTYSDLNFPAEMRVNAALVTNRGQTYVIFDGDSVALMNECDMTIREYHSLKAIFPGIPSSPTAAYRYIDGSLHFLQKRQYYKFNEFTQTVTNADNFNMKILNVNCPTDGLLRQLQDLLNRLLQSNNLLEYTAEDALDD